MTGDQQTGAAREGPGPTVVFDFTDRPLDAMVAGCGEDPLLDLIVKHVPAGGRVLGQNASYVVAEIETSEPKDLGQDRALVNDAYKPKGVDMGSPAPAATTTAPGTTGCC